MKDATFKHDAVNKLSVLYGQFWQLERDARANINDDLAIEVRDLCQDVIHKIDMFGRQYATAER